MPPPSRADEIASIRAELQGTLHEDAINLEWILEKVERLGWAFGHGVHSNLLLLLFNLTFDEAEARRHWEAMLHHRVSLEAALGRAVGLRVAAMDYLVALNRQTSRPRLFELL